MIMAKLPSPSAAPFTGLSTCQFRMRQAGDGAVSYSDSFAVSPRDFRPLGCLALALLVGRRRAVAFPEIESGEVRVREMAVPDAPRHLRARDNPAYFLVIRASVTEQESTAYRQSYNRERS